MGLFGLKKSSNKRIMKKDNTPKEVLKVYQGYPELPYISPERDIKEWLETVALFGKKVPIENMKRLPEGLLPGHIILLWRVNFGNFTNLTTIPTYCEYEYGINGQSELQNLKTKQYICESTASNSLRFMTVPQLKNMLEGQKVKPKKLKDDLIEQIREISSDDWLENNLYIRGYDITKKGVELLNKYQSIVTNHKS